VIGDVRDAGGVFANLPGRTMEAFEAAGARLARLSRTIAGGAQAVPLPDGAGWQGAKALKVADTIPLMPIPPHAPRINPVGNLRA
jgi:hypothetical protein